MLEYFLKPTALWIKDLAILVAKAQWERFLLLVYFLFVCMCTLTGVGVHMRMWETGQPQGLFLRNCLLYFLRCSFASTYAF